MTILPSRAGLMALPLLAAMASAASVSFYPLSPPSDATLGTRDATFSAQGCLHEPPRSQDRALKAKSTSSDDMTTATCADFCSGYKYFGTEYGRECYCGYVITTSSDTVDASACSMPCAGDDSQTCGAGDLLNLYLNTAYVEPSVAIVLGATPLGCAIDNAGNRVLPALQDARDNMTPALCASICGDYAYFGVEYGRECYCGKTAPINFVTAGDNQCNMPCSGDASALCGGPDRLHVYKSTTSAMIPATVSDYHFLHCGVDNVSQRVLGGASTHGQDMTVEKCAAFCAGSTFFGLEYARECFCGDTYATRMPRADEECYMKCTGNPSQLCGAGDRIAIYDKTPVVAPPAPVICRRKGWCTGLTGAVTVGTIATEDACRAAVANVAAVRNFVAYYYTDAKVCWGFTYSIFGAQCRFQDDPTFNGWHGDLVCPS